MQGHFDVKTLGARGLKDEDFKAAINEGQIRSLLAELKVHQHAGGKNMIFDNFAGHCLDRLFSMPACAAHFNEENGSAALAYLYMMNYDPDPTYTETWSHVDGGTSIYTEPQYRVSDNCSKRFEEDQIDPWEIWVDTGGREAIHFRNRVLFLPAESVSSDIRSIGICFMEVGNSTGGYYVAHGRLGRVRLRDKNGVKVIMSKNNREVLLVEYTFTYVTL